MSALLCFLTEHAIGIVVGAWVVFGVFIIGFILGEKHD